MRNLAGLWLVMIGLAVSRALGADAGALPTGVDGKPLNLDLESGTLKDWKVEGKAFENQPFRGEIADSPGRGEKHARPQGNFWIGTYERFGDAPQGTLTSVPFRASQPWASFLVGGGQHPQTRVELLERGQTKAFFAASGRDDETMRRVKVDLRPVAGKEIVIRIVDGESGGWGHINFDDFRLHAEAPDVPAEPSQLLPDEYRFSGLKPEEAAREMTVPEGFRVTLFAGEPDVHQPIAQAIDDRGRLWIAEAFNYPRRAAEGEGRDRIVIFEDRDGDGRFDTRKTFAEKLNLVSGLEVGFGGVWVGAAPYLLFIPDKNGDDVPDDKPQVLLDGWHYEDTHETLNSFIWGPDGWLYGCHGVFTHSRVGKPGTPDAERTPINAGVWRYHPVRQKFEVFAHGTSNPWGLDFNEHGQAFITACVIPHLYHMIPMARYERQAGEHFNPYTFDDIKTIADHRHYQGDNPHRGNDRSDSAGGGHAHAGAMIYLGGAWPERYRGKIFMNNIHGQRLNMDILEPRGSGYVGKHGPDFLLTNDRWSQILNLQYGPDGQMFMIDWYDKNACHHNDVNGHDRTNGRIFRVFYGEPKPVAVDLAQLSDLQLARLIEHKNEWYVRHGRRVLQERAAQRAIDPAAIEYLLFTLEQPRDEVRHLRALWAAHVIGQDFGILHLWSNPSPQVRAWKVRLEVEHALSIADPAERSKWLAGLAELFEGEHFESGNGSPVVRLALLAMLQRMPVEMRQGALTRLLAKRGDPSDHNLPLVQWWALEPLAGTNAGSALTLAVANGTPRLVEFVSRRIAAGGETEGIATALDTVTNSDEEEVRLAVLTGLNAGLRGQRNVAAPGNWPALFTRLNKSKNGRLVGQARSLAVTFGDAATFDVLRGLILDGAVPLAEREQALSALVKAKDAKLPPVLRQLLSNSQLRAAAVRGLATFDDAQTPPAVLKVYAALPPAEKREALATLASRGAFALPLLDAVGGGKIPPSDLSADLIRQLKNLNDPIVLKRLNEVWGTVQESTADVQKQIERYTKLLAKPAPAPTDLAQGRAIFAKTCQQCHTLFGVGGAVGPDLTGSNRANLEYLLSNVLDPSAVMAKEYMPATLILEDGRVVTGIIKQQDKNVLTVQTATELLTLARADVETIKPGTTSMMPNDLLKPLSDEEVRALTGYLASPTQTPMLATPDNAGGLFNGKDLAGWRGDPKLWSVENGELVGRTEGLDHNEFLVSDLVVSDFKLTVEVKLARNDGNSGIQFRSEAMGAGGAAQGDVRGYQADIGPGWWGKLYEEHGRGLLWDKSGEEQVRLGDWNRYEIEARGDDIRTAINGRECVKLVDPAGAKRGILALQLHAGGAMEVRFRNFQLQVLPAASGK